MLRLFLALAIALTSACASAQTVGNGTQRLEAAVNPCADTFLKVDFLSVGCVNDVQVANYSAIAGLSLSAGTVTGAGAQVWAPDNTGTLQAFASGVNKITNAGLSLWGAANGNAQIQSNNFGNAAWTATGQQLTTNSPDFLSPDGTNDMTKLLVNGGSARIQSSANITVTPSTTRVASVSVHTGNQAAFILASTEAAPGFSGDAAVVIDSTACTVSNSFAGGGWVIVATGAQPEANGNCRAWVAYTLDGTSTAITLQLNPGTGYQSSNTGFSSYIWGAQDTLGSSLPPYVSTAAVAATVTADTATVTCSPGCTDGGTIAMAKFNGGDLASVVSASSFNLADTSKPWAGLPIQSLTVTAGTVPLYASQLGYNTVTYAATSFSAANVDTGCAGTRISQIYCAGTSTGYGGWGTPTFVHSGFSGADLLVGGGANQFNGIFGTAMFTPQGGTTVKGIVFGKGFVAHAVFSLPNILPSGNTYTSGWPSFWDLAYEAITAKTPDEYATGLPLPCASKATRSRTS